MINISFTRKNTMPGKIRLAICRKEVFLDYNIRKYEKPKTYLAYRTNFYTVLTDYFFFASQYPI